MPLFQWLCEQRMVLYIYYRIAMRSCDFFTFSTYTKHIFLNSLHFAVVDMCLLLLMYIFFHSFTNIKEKVLHWLLHYHSLCLNTYVWMCGILNTHIHTRRKKLSRFTFTIHIFAIRLLETAETFGKKRKRLNVLMNFIWTYLQFVFFLFLFLQYRFLVILIVLVR